MPADERPTLVDQLFGIFSEFFDDLDREGFRRSYLDDERTRLALCYADDGALVGFSAASISEVRVVGRSYAVFSAPVIVRLGFRAGAEVALFGLTEALSFKLRHPWMPLAYVSATSTPASYALFARTVNRFHPSRGAEAPGAILAALEQVRAMRGLERVGDSPWVVRSGRPLGAARIRAESSLRENPAVAFFEELSPRWLDGEALLVWIPLDLGNIVAGIGRAVRDSLPSRRSRRDRAPLEVVEGPAEAPQVDKGAGNGT